MIAKTRRSAEPMWASKKIPENHDKTTKASLRLTKRKAFHSAFTIFSEPDATSIAIRIAKIHS